VHLYDLPLICVLIGLALYVILGGADFGAGLWQLATIVWPGRTPEKHERARSIREYAHHAMGPVWEANHVWLIFVLTVTWTAYPGAFGAIAATLVVPLFLAGLGVVFRGAAYALRAGTAKASELGLIDTIFSLSSILTPFALGTIIGAIAAQRVAGGETSGAVLSSWLSPLSVLIGVLAVSVSAYLAAVYLAADAARDGERQLVEQFRLRALVAGVLAGVVALAGLPVLHAEAHRVYTRLTDGPGLVGLVVSALAGVGTLVLVTRRRFEAARVSAALAVAGVILGWALAQQPILLAHLTVAQAAAGHETIIALLAAIAVGGAILFPSLGLLFGLLLRGRFDHAEGRPEADAPLAARELLARLSDGLCARLALAGLLGGLGLLTVAEAPWAHGIGVACLFACMIFAFLAVEPGQLAAHAQDSEPTRLRLPRRGRRRG